MGAAETTPGIVVDTFTAADTAVAFWKASTMVTRFVFGSVLFDTRVICCTGMPLLFARASASELNVTLGDTTNCALVGAAVGCTVVMVLTEGGAAVVDAAVGEGETPESVG